MRPRRLQPRLPRDLEAITLHCLEKEPGRRYSSALALAEDLHRFQEGKHVVVRPVGAAARLARACRRRPLITLLVTLLAASLLGGLAAVTWKWLEANAHARHALFQAYRARMAAAAAALSAHDVADAARELDAAPESLRGWEWRHLRSRLDDSSSVIASPVRGALFLLGASDRLRAGTMTTDGLRLTDLDGGDPRTVPIGQERGSIEAVAQTLHGLRVVARLLDSTFEVFDEAGQVVCRVGMPKSSDRFSAVISPDGNRLASHGFDGEKDRIVMFDATSGKQTAVCEGHDRIWSIAFSPDGTRLASAGEDQTARLWDPATGALLATFRGHTSKVIGVAFSPNGTRLLTASADGTVRQWDAGTSREVEAPYDRHAGEVFAAAYSPDGQWVASAGSDRTVRVWRASGRQDVAILHGHTGAVHGVEFAPDGRRLASLSRESEFVWAGDSTVRVWDVDPEATLPALRGHTSFVYPVAFSPDGRWLASGGWDSTVRLWDAATGEPCATLPHPGVVSALAYGPDGTWLVSATFADDRLRIWDVATARVRKEIQVPAGTLTMLALSPDGSRVAATAPDQQSKYYQLHVCGIASGECLFSAEGLALTYSPDGRWLAVRAADEKTVLLLDARTHQTAARFTGHEKLVWAATFSPDSRRLASCSGDSTVRLWQVKSGACQVLRGHTDEVFAAAFHPDGSRLATAGRDRAVWLWDLATGEEVARLPGHTSYVWSLAFSPDGNTLASGSGDFTVRLWDTAPLKMRYQARREALALRPEAARLVAQLFAERLEPAEVVARLQADQTLNEPLRHAALRVVMRRAQQFAP